MGASVAGWIVGACTVCAAAGVVSLGLRAARRTSIRQLSPEVARPAARVVGRRDIRYALSRGAPIEDVNDARGVLTYLGDDPYAETMAVWRTATVVVDALCVVWIVLGLLARERSFVVVGVLVSVGSTLLYWRQWQLHRRMVMSIEATRRLHGSP